MSDTEGHGSATPYTPEFYGELSEAARDSAEVIVPRILDLVGVSSVVDVGCGTGAWLAAFRARGVDDVVGLDGPHVRTDTLEIPADRFRVRDLEGRLGLDRQFDLVICLEVAEHLDESRAGSLVDELTGLGDVVLFSAAIPHQGGTDHRNEQWPAYWMKRFARYGFHPVDCLRFHLLEDDRVAWWYAQNTVLYASDAGLKRHPALARARHRSPSPPPALVHPACFLDMVEWGLEMWREARDA